MKYDYKNWKETIQDEKVIEVINEPTLQYNRASDKDKILTMIKNYDLANSTPMQGLGFIQVLKLEIQRLEKNNGNI